jgi:hypothetical protein
MVEREEWGTRAGFILAAVGSAIGLGNIWHPVGFLLAAGVSVALGALLVGIALSFLRWPQRRIEDPVIDVTDVALSDGTTRSARR